VADARLWPLQDADAGYFFNHGIHVTDDGLVQDPGHGNPLGRVKFLFDNPAGIALHDTPDEKALQDPDRYTSLGCVAVDRAEDLARALLASDPDWPPTRIDVALAGGAPDIVSLAQPMPLHIVYDTAWVDEDGTVEFRNDVYGWDSGAAPPPPLKDPAGPCGS
jgi:murein L,D-transpeptidase YcbB/YkuD